MRARQDHGERIGVDRIFDSNPDARPIGGQPLRRRPLVWIDRRPTLEQVELPALLAGHDQVSARPHRRSAAEPTPPAQQVRDPPSHGRARALGHLRQRIINEDLELRLGVAEDRRAQVTKLLRRRDRVAQQLALLLAPGLGRQQPAPARRQGPAA